MSLNKQANLKKSKTILVIALLAIVFLLSSHSVDAKEVPYPVTKKPVSYLEPIIRAQEHPNIIPDGSGGVVVTWGFGKIYQTKVISSDYLLHTSTPSIICDSINNPRYPNLIPDGSRGAIIAWNDGRDDANGDTNGLEMTLYAQRLSSEGQELWTKNGVVAFSRNITEWLPGSVAPDTTGGAIILGEKYDLNHDEAYVQRIDASGNILWGENGITVIQGRIESGAVMVSDNSGGAFITWGDGRNLYAQRISASGNKLWGDGGLVISHSAYSDIDPDLISDGAGGAIITWADYSSRGKDGNHYLYAQKIDSSGKVVWNPGAVKICSSMDCANPILVSDSSNGAVVLWLKVSKRNYTIYAQRINESGNILWEKDGVAIGNNQFSISRFDAISNGSGGALVTWLYSGDDFRIYAQHVDGAGNPLWQRFGINVSDQVYFAGDPKIASDGSGGAFLVWDEDHNLINNVYVQRIDSSGTPNSSYISIFPTYEVRALPESTLHTLPIITWIIIGGGVALILFLTTFFLRRRKRK